MTLPAQLLTEVRSKAPLVHFITNYVTVNDCANITLACGASPLMSDEQEEVGHMVALASALVLNMGTLNRRTLASMLHAGKHANALGVPIVFDPVGAGASDFRNQAATCLLQELRFAVIKGNMSEIKFLACGMSETKGVDAASRDIVCESTMADSLPLVQALAQGTNSVVAVTGPIDLVADSTQGYALHNGHAMMSRVTGSGCMTAALVGCCVAAVPTRPLQATLGAIAAMGICGEMAHAALPPLGGNASLRNGIIDAACHLTDGDLAAKAKIMNIG